MTNLKKRLSFSVVSLIALVFCCLVIGQAVTAKLDVKVSAENEGKVNQQVEVPLPDTPRGGNQGSAAAIDPSDFPEGKEIPFVAKREADDPLRWRGKGGSASMTGGEDIGSAVAIPAPLPGGFWSDLGSTAAAADDYDEICPYNAPGSPDVVYSYTPLGVEVLDISTCGTVGTTYDTKLYVYENAATPGSPYACSDDGGGCPGFTSLITGMTVLPGNTYYIVVDGYGGDAGDYNLEITSGDPYDCAFVGGVPEGEVCLTETNGGCFGPGGGQPITPGTTICGITWADGGADHDFFEYTVAGPNDEFVTWTASAETPFATYIYDPSGCPSFLTAAGWAPYSTGVSQAVLSPGTYWFRVRVNAGGGYACGTNPNPASGGDWRYTATLTTVALTPVDECLAAGGPLVDDGATLVEDGTNVLDLTTATPGGGISGGFLPNNWYTYEATCTGFVTVSFCASNTLSPLDDFDAFIWDACPDVGGVAIAGSQDDGCGTFHPSFSFVASSGNTYYLEVLTWSPFFGGTDIAYMDISCVPLALEYDDCADALDLTGDHFGLLFTNDGANTDGPDQDSCSPMGADVWVRYTTDCVGEITVDMSGFDAQISAYDGHDCLDVTPREPIACINGSINHQNFTGATLWLDSPAPGTEYLIRLAGWNGDSGVFFLDIFCDTPLPRSSYDACDGEPPLALIPDGTVSVVGETTLYSTTATCFAQPPGTWHAFTIDFCADVAVDFCDGTATYDSDVDVVTWNSPELFTACPCADGISFPSNTFFQDCGGEAGIVSDTYLGLTPGTYYYYVADVGQLLSAYESGEYDVNFTTTELECAYCPSSANDALCVLPPANQPEHIANVSISALNNPSDCGGAPDMRGPAGADVPGYADYTTEVVDGGSGLVTGGNVFRGITYQLDIEIDNPHPDMTIAAWVDWNQDYDLGLFSPAEFLFVSDPGVSSWSEQITIPLDAVLGDTGPSGRTVLRISISRSEAETDDPGYGPTTPCHGEYLFGETEDYLLVCEELICGDFDGDDDRDAADVTFLKDYYFTEGPLPDVQERADINADCCINIADIVFLADFVHRGGADPVCIPCQ